MTDLLALTAVLAPAVGGALAWRLPLHTASRVSAMALGVAAAAALVLAWSASTGEPQVGFNGLLRLDAFGAWILAVVVLVALLAIAASPRYLVSELGHQRIVPADPGHYYALTLWFVACLMVVPMLDNLGLVWVALEGATAVSTLLVGFYRTPRALEAAWKYLILGSVGIGFALLGTVLVYASSVGILGETSDALNWSRLMASAAGLDPGLLRLGFLFVLVGYGTKIGLAPFHTWLPDAHSQAPSPISALLSGVSLAVALYVLVRFHLVAQAALGPSFSAVLLVGFGLLTIAVALPFLVAQGDLKRLLAYSSIEHMGLLTLAIGFGGRLALLGATLLVLAHALAKATAFLAAGDLVQQYGSPRLGRLRGTIARAPDAGPGLLVAAIVVGGLPPSAVFVGEIAIIFGGVQTGWLVPAGFAAVLLGLGFAALTFHAVHVAWGAPGRRVPSVSRSATLGSLLLGPLVVVMVLGLWTPAPMAQVLDAVVAVLGGARA